jgi:hypothetical protein
MSRQTEFTAAINKVLAFLDNTTSASVCLVYCAGAILLSVLFVWHTNPFMWLTLVVGGMVGMYGIDAEDLNEQFVTDRWLTLLWLSGLGLNSVLLCWFIGSKPEIDNYLLFGVKVRSLVAIPIALQCMFAGVALRRKFRGGKS